MFSGHFIQRRKLAALHRNCEAVWVRLFFCIWWQTEKFLTLLGTKPWLPSLQLVILLTNSNGVLLKHTSLKWKKVLYIFYNSTRFSNRTKQLPSTDYFQISFNLLLIQQIVKLRWWWFASLLWNWNWVIWTSAEFTCHDRFHLKQELLTAMTQISRIKVWCTSHLTGQRTRSHLKNYSCHE